MNFESPIIQDAAVRKAIAMGIDKEGFVNTLLDGNGYPAVGTYPENFSLAEMQLQQKVIIPRRQRRCWRKPDGWI